MWSRLVGGAGRAGTRTSGLASPRSAGQAIDALPERSLVIAYFCTFIGGRLGGETQTLARRTESFQDGLVVAVAGELYEVSRLQQVETGEARCTMTYRGLVPEESTDVELSATSDRRTPEDARIESVPDKETASTHSMGGTPTLWFQAGAVAKSLGWPEGGVVSCSELTGVTPAGPPLVAVGTGITPEQSQTVAALRGAGRDIRVITLQRPSDEALAWLGDSWAQLNEPFGSEGAGGAGAPAPDPTSSNDVRASGGSAPDTAFGLVEELGVATMESGTDYDYEDEAANAAIAQVMRATPVTFAWDKPVMWLADGGCGDTDIISLRNLRNEPEWADMDLVRQAPEIDMSRFGDWGAVQEYTFGGSGRSEGAPILFINVNVGDGQALLACAYQWAPRVFFSTDADPSPIRDFLPLLMTGSPEGATRGLPTRFTRAPGASGIVSEVLGGVATSLFCLVIDRGVRELLRNPPDLDRSLQATWAAAADRLSH